MVGAMGYFVLCKVSLRNITIRLNISKSLPRHHALQLPRLVCQNPTFLGGSPFRKRTTVPVFHFWESHAYHHSALTHSATTATRGRGSAQSAPARTRTAIRSYPGTSADTAGSGGTDCVPSASAAAPACGTRTGRPRTDGRRCPARPSAIPPDRIPSTTADRRRGTRTGRPATAGLGSASPRTAAA